MSAADDSLDDARGFIAQAIAALKHRDMAAAILYLCSAERFHGLATSMASSYRIIMGVPTAGVDEVGEAIAALRDAVTRAVTPKRANPRDVQADITEGLEVLRSLHGVPLTDEQISDRARNVTSGLCGNYDIREAP